MTDVSEILGTLTRSRLLEIARSFDIYGLSGKTKAAIVASLSGSRSVSAENVLHGLKRSELKAVCRRMGIDDRGREKSVLVERLIRHEDARGQKRHTREHVEKKAHLSQGRKIAGREKNPHKNNRKLETSTLESWLWEAACVIRGPVDAPKFKDFILPLVFLKRLSDVFEDEIHYLAADFGGKDKALQLVEQSHHAGQRLVRFFIPKNARWSEIATRTSALGEYLTDAVRAVARRNPRLSGVIDVTDFNATQAGQRILDDDRLRSMVQVLSDHRLGLEDVEPDILGRAYEYLLRKFAEGQGSSAGEFYTPREVGILMARVLDPEPGQTIYDPACGSGGLLIKTHLRLMEKHGEIRNGARRLPSDVAPLHLYGQEINHATFAMARMNAFIHDMEADIALGDTMARPAFTNTDGSLSHFDLVTANPMWNQKFNASTYENDSYGRFIRGVPPLSSADWGWIQHMHASLNEGGKMAVVLDTGAVSRGSGNQGSNKERDIRKALVEADLVEAVFLLPENLFYNTTAPGIILVLNRRKEHPGEILLINGTKQFSKGRPKNYLDEKTHFHVGRMLPEEEGGGGAFCDHHHA